MKSKKCSLKNFISLTRCTGLIDWNQEFDNDFPVDVEIGFGTGENIISLADANPRRNYVGIEQDRKRLLRAMRKITLFEKEGGKSLNNLRLVGVDAWIVFERFFNLESVGNIYCLFPCPWPKKKHIKFRLFNQDFLRLLNSRLKKEGNLRIVTDFHPFFKWILEQAVDTGFTIQRDIVDPRYNTKFEKKWREQGQEQFYELCLKKKLKQLYPLKKEVPLKAYKVTHFNPESFHFPNREGEISVIFKEMLFDEARQKAMLLFVVSEQNLTQNFWVSIAKKEEWIISRAIGQNLLQTPGLSLALELVSEEAQKKESG